MGSDGGGNCGDCAIGDGCIMLFPIIIDMGGTASALDPNGTGGGISAITDGP